MPFADVLGLKRDSTTGALLVTGVADRDNGNSGLYVPTVAGSGTNYQGAARTVYMRFRPSRVMTIINLQFAIGVAAAADDTIELGFMTAAGARLQTTGPLTGKLNATGVKTAAITPIVFQPDTTYYAAMSTTAPGGTASQFCAKGKGFSQCWDMPSNAIPRVECANESGVTAIPATMGAFSAQIGAYPELFLSEV